MPVITPGRIESLAEYDRIAGYYDAIFSRVFPYEAEAAALGRLFRQYPEREIRTVLDASCGTGSHALLLSKAGYQCTGSDISPGMLEQARRKALSAGESIEFFERDIKRLAMERRFDAVISLYGLPLMLVTESYGDSGAFPDTLKRALLGIHHVLEDDGLLVFNVIEAGSPVPFPGFGPWCRSNIQPVTANGLEIVVMNKLCRRRDLLDFKDVYFVEENGRLVMEILEYSVWLPDLRQLETILGSGGFRMIALYSSLSALENFSQGSLDATVVAAKAGTRRHG